MMRHRRGVVSSTTTMTVQSEQQDGEASTAANGSRTNNSRGRNAKSFVSWISSTNVVVMAKRQQKKKPRLLVALVVVGFVLLLLVSPKIVHHLHHQSQQQTLRHRTTTSDKYQAIQEEHTSSSKPYYDVYSCPELPPLNYPREYPILDVLQNWNTQQLRPPKYHYQGICIIDLSDSTNTMFDLRTKRRQIDNYRSAEVPFVIRNDPQVLQSVQSWSSSASGDNYLQRKLQDKKFQATISNTTRLTYYSMDQEYNIIPDDFVPFTHKTEMTYEDWYQRASTQQQQQHRQQQEQQDQQEYAYLRLDACLPNSKHCDSTYLGSPNIIDNADFVYDDLKFFQPGHSGYYPINETETRGVQCRLAPPGIVAENHFDNERNYIALLKGQRRYLLSHPQNCPTFYLHQQKHPLERHTQVDYDYVSSLLQLEGNEDGDEDNDSKLKSFLSQHYPQFEKTTINEVVLQAGDVLYLPTYWFHHIISLTTNYQCNTRSGYSVEYDQAIYDCGFLYDFPEYLN